MTAHLNLGVIGNCQVSSLIDDRARHVWTCLPRFDGDPMFCALLRNEAPQDAKGLRDRPRGLYPLCAALSA